MSTTRHVRKKVDAFCNRRQSKEIRFTRISSLMEKLRLHNMSPTHFQRALEELGYRVDQDEDGRGVLYVS